MIDIDAYNGHSTSVNAFGKDLIEENINVNLLSAWNVNREHRYKTEGNIDEDLFCLIRTIQGKAILKTIDKEFTLSPGTLLIVRFKNVLEYYPIKDSWDYSWYNFYATEKLPFFKRNVVYDIPITRNEERLNEEIFKILIRYSKINYTIANGMFKELILRYINYFEDLEFASCTHYKELNEVIKFINDNFTLPIEIEDLAKRCYLSERQFRNIFKQFTGLSPKNYIIEKRLEYISWLLKTTNKTINDISNELNMYSPYQLSRDFKKMYGVSPNEYRKEIKKGA